MNPFEKTKEQQAVAPMVWVAWIALLVVMGAIILGFTPLTHNLDDIKVTLLHIGGGGLLVLFCWLWLRGDLALPHRMVMIPLAAWIGLMILTSLLHQLHLVPRPNPYQWIGWIQIGQYLALLGLFVIHASVMKNYRMVEAALTFWIWVVLIECGFGLIHWSGIFKKVYEFLYFNRPPRDLLASLIYTFNSSSDMIGTILNRQFFGDLLALWAPLCLAGAVIWKDFRRRVFAIFALVMSGPCVYLTFSKASIPFYMLSIVMTAAGILLFTRHRKITIPHLPYVVGGILSVLVTLSFFTWDTIEERFKSVGFSLHSREIIWDGGLAIFQRNPILGAGAGCFRVLFPEYRSPDYHLTQISNVTLWSHNRFIDLLAENGIVGTACYLAFLGIILWRALRLLRTAEDERFKVIAIALVSGIIGFLGTAVFHPGIRWIIGAAPYWAILGMTAGLPAAAFPEKEALPGRRRAVRLEPAQRLVRLAALVGAVVVWINPLPPSRPFFYSNFGYGIRYLLGAKNNNDGLILINQSDPEVSGGRLSPAERRQLRQQAVERFRAAVRWNPTFVTTYYKMAHGYNLLEDHVTSLEVYFALQRYAPHYSEIHYNLGVIHRMVSDLFIEKMNSETDARRREDLRKESEQHLMRSLEEYAIAAKMSNKISVQFSHAAALEEVARTLAGREPESTLRYYRQAAQVYDQIRDLPLTVATQEENQIKREEGLRDSAIRRAPMLYERVGDWGDAARAYREVFRLEPGNTVYMRKAVECYLKANDPAEAKGVLERALSRSALNFEARDVLAGLLAKQTDRESLEQAWKHSQVLRILDRQFPNEIPVGIRTGNLQRLADLAKALGDEQRGAMYLKDAQGALSYSTSSAP
jgi:O-antigen ligase/tetratricopeptide (TPR) repeat protein